MPAPEWTLAAAEETVCNVVAKRGLERYPTPKEFADADERGAARSYLARECRLTARQFTRKPRTADHAPGLPAESNARARQKRSAFGSDVVEN